MSAVGDDGGGRALLNAAERHLYEEEHEESLQAAAQAYEHFRSAGDIVGEADALRLKIGSLRVAALYVLIVSQAKYAFFFITRVSSGSIEPGML